METSQRAARIVALRDQVMAAMRRNREAITLIADGKGQSLPNYHDLAEMMACMIAGDLALIDAENDGQ